MSFPNTSHHRLSHPSSPLESSDKSTFSNPKHQQPKPVTKSSLTLITNQAHLQTSRKMLQALTTDQLSQESDAIYAPRKWKFLLFFPCYRRDSSTERIISTQTLQVPSKPNSSVCVVVLLQICQHLPSTKTFVNFPCSATKEAITKSLQVFLLLRNFIFISSF